MPRFETLSDSQGFEPPARKKRNWEKQWFAPPPKRGKCPSPERGNRTMLRPNRMRLGLLCSECQTVRQYVGWHLLTTVQLEEVRRVWNDPGEASRTFPPPLSTFHNLPDSQQTLGRTSSEGGKAKQKAIMRPKISFGNAPSLLLRQITTTGRSCNKMALRRSTQTSCMHNVSVSLLGAQNRGITPKCSRECSQKPGCSFCYSGRERESTLESTLGSTFGDFSVLGSLAS